MYGYGAQLTGRGGGNGNPEILSIIWWSNMCQTVPSSRPRIDGVYCIPSYTRHRAPDGLLTSYQTTFGTTDVLITVHAWQSAYVIEHNVDPDLTDTYSIIVDLTLVLLALFHSRYKFHDPPHFIPSFQCKRGCWR
jgi:hypothetical protein